MFMEDFLGIFNFKKAVNLNSKFSMNYLKTYKIYFDKTDNQVHSQWFYFSTYLCMILICYCS